MPLGNFLADICERIGTSKRYTNHCIRVSSTSAVTRTGKYSNCEVMDLSGHKSVQSLTIYQHIQLKRKMEMANNLNKALNKTNNKIEEEKNQQKEVKHQPRAVTNQAPAIHEIQHPVVTPPPVPDEAPLINQPDQLIVPYEPKWDIYIIYLQAAYMYHIPSVMLYVA